MKWNTEKGIKKTLECTTRLNNCFLSKPETQQVDSLNTGDCQTDQFVMKTKREVKAENHLLRRGDSERTGRSLSSDAILTQNHLADRKTS